VERLAIAAHGQAADRHRVASHGVSALELRNLIRQMSLANPRWGALRIHGELLKIEIELCQATVAKYIARHRRHPLRRKRASDKALRLWGSQTDP
jgi:hypothetical protein